MPGSKVNTYGSTNTSLTNIMQVLDAVRSGFSAIALTNYTTTALPSIVAGSKIEISNSVYQFSSEEPISTNNISSTAANNTWYIKLVPSSSEVTAFFSTVAPTWRDDYFGYYESTSSINKYVGSLYYSSGSYLYKYIYSGENRDFMVYGKITSSLVNIPYPNGFSSHNTQCSGAQINNSTGGYWTPNSVYLFSSGIAIFDSTVYINQDFKFKLFNG